MIIAVSLQDMSMYKFKHVFFSIYNKKYIVKNLALIYNFLGTELMN
jgi:hypothetical protein